MFRPTEITSPGISTSEVHGSMPLPGSMTPWQRRMRFAGPGLLVAVGYMDPGNWATDIEAGARFGYTLLFVVLMSSLAAIVLQVLALRLGVITQMDLARACRERYQPAARNALWVMAELAIIACDVAEVLGSALALHLLFDVSLTTGVLITGLDTFIVLGLRGRGFRQLEAIVLGLILTIGICFTIELALAGLDWTAVGHGFIPHVQPLRDPRALYLAIGILGATVMPHNLYLHSSVVQTRLVARDESNLRTALRLLTWDTVISLSLALFVNAAILTLAASAFHSTGHTEVAEIQDAYHLLDPVVGSQVASLLFGIALLAAGQSSTLTGTIAGQIILQGFLNLKIPLWQRRIITRGLALMPALIGITLLGEDGVGKLLVMSQVVLSFQLPFAVWPLIRLTSDSKMMGKFSNNFVFAALAWLLFAIIVGANMSLLWSIVH